MLLCLLICSVYCSIAYVSIREPIYQLFLCIFTFSDSQFYAVFLIIFLIDPFFIGYASCICFNSYYVDMNYVFLSVIPLLTFDVNTLLHPGRLFIISAPTPAGISNFRPASVCAQNVLLYIYLYICSVKPLHSVPAYRGRQIIYH